jgi:hypothetical protein
MVLGVLLASGRRIYYAVSYAINSASYPESIGNMQQ